MTLFLLLVIGAGVNLGVALLCAVWRELFLLRTGTDVIELLRRRRAPRRERKIRL